MERGFAGESLAMAARNPQRTEEAGLWGDVTPSGSSHTQDKGVFSATSIPSHEAQW